MNLKRSSSLVRLKVLASLLLLMHTLIMLSGCSSQNCCLTLSLDEKNYTSHIVIGFGIINVNKPEYSPAAQIIQYQSLGISYSELPSSKFSLGYNSGHLISVPNNAEDVRIEVTSEKDKFSINVPCAQLKNSKQGNCYD